MEPQRISIPASGFSFPAGKIKRAIPAILLAAILLAIVAGRPAYRDETFIPGHRQTNSGSFAAYSNAGDTIRDSICFSEEIMPLINFYCAGCHDGNHRIPLEDYSEVAQITRPFYPDSSLLYKVISGAGKQMPPEGNPALSEDQILLIRNWIAQGAKENAGCGNCDTITFTYSGTIGPIVRDNCVSCHSGFSPAAGISLQNYNDVVVVAKNGLLWGSVNHVMGYAPMPAHAPMLSPCKLQQIRKWIDAGAPGN